MDRNEKIALFWSRVDRSGGPSSCWLWTRSIFTATGYGQVTGLDDARKPTTAHRLAWILTNGDPGSYVHPRTGRETTRRVLHRCPDGPNRLCCNPAHLALGTDQDNADDRHRDGNQAHGEHMGSAKLREEQLLEIRLRHAGGDTVRQLAREFDVHEGTIRPIIQGKTWRHLAGAA